MGKIQVGQKKPRTIDMGGFTVAQSAAVENKGMTAEEKAVLVKKIMAMPKAQIVAELRKHGFNELADITEVKLKSEAESAKQEDAREKRLAEILALPEDEQLPLLLEEGYTDEAQELSAKLASQQEKTDDGSGDSDGETPDTGDEDGAGEAADESAGTGDGVEPEKKKGGRPKKAQ